MRCTIVPPHILRHVAEQHGDEQVRELAQRTLTLDHQQRRVRDAAQLIAQPPPATAPAAANRTLHDAGHQETLPGRTVRSEGAPATGDQQVDEVYDWLGVTFDFYNTAYGRNSIDGAGLPLVATVHYGVDYDNAFWEGSQMVYGDGDQDLFKTFTGPLDVTGHELTHGVTQFTAALNYTPDQSGALNESFSDMFGSAIDAWAAGNDAETHNWLIGEDVMADDLYGEALRSMAEPGTAYDNPLMGRDPQPRDMSGYYDGADPHIMSGITNRWFYLICREIGIDAGALIMYQTLQNLWPNATFNDAALVAAAQARILSATKEVPSESPQVVRAMARQQGFW
jgi:Zn-dependent metalloprotease